jgi:hypothetical protein
VIEHMTQKILFFSHAQTDDTLADEIASAIEKEVNVRVWRDHLHLPPGTNWSRVIGSTLSQCGSGMLLLTHASANSEECEAEWWELVKSKKMLYVLVFGEPPIPWRLRTREYTLLTKPFNQCRGVDVLIDAIRYDKFLMQISPPSQDLAIGRLVPFSGVLRLVRFVLDLSFPTVSKVIGSFVHTISMMLGLSDDDIGLEGMEPGSTIVTLKMPEEAAKLLMELYQKEPQLLIDWDVISVTLLPLKEQRHEAPNFHESSFHESSKLGSASELQST